MINCLACGSPCVDPQGRTWCRAYECHGHADKRCLIVSRRGKPTSKEVDLCAHHAQCGSSTFRVVRVLGDAPRRAVSDADQGDR